MFHKMRCNFSELTPAVALVKVEGLILYDGPSIPANWPALITGHGHATLAHQFIHVNGRSQIETNNGLTIHTIFHLIVAYRASVASHGDLHSP